jgi:hypothetical protein
MFFFQFSTIKFLQWLVIGMFFLSLQFIMGLELIQLQVVFLHSLKSYNFHKLIVALGPTK